MTKVKKRLLRMTEKEKTLAQNDRNRKAFV
jgi:hypothetical protein